MTFNNTWGVIEIGMRAEKKQNQAQILNINEDGIPIDILTKTLK